MPFLGITASIASAVIGIGSFLAGGTALAQIALAGLSMAANYAMQKFFGPKAPPAQASQLETQYGEKLARTIIQGKVGTAGHHLYRNVYGKGNRMVQDVFVLSHWNIAGVTRVRFKGEWKTLGGAVDAERGQRIQDIDAEVWVKVYTGTMTQQADAGLISRSNPPGRWTANHRGAGVAYAIVTNRLSRDHLQSPWEAFFEVEGVTYDWRKDSSVGGSGAHRYNDPSTWEPTSNPILMAYCATRGFWRGNEKIVGKGRSASALPLAQWTLAANIASETILGKPRYQAACIFSSGEGATHDGNLQPLIEASAASWLELVGEEYPIAGANQTPVTSFTDDDIILGEPFRFSEHRTRTTLVNTVAGTYVDPSSFYQAMPLATRVDEVALAADRERLAVPLSFAAVTDPACADRLADIALRASRYQGNGEICLRHKYLALRPGQWVTWTSARRGWTKTFVVLSKRLGSFGANSARNVYVSLQEVGAGVFDPTAYVTAPPDGIGQGAPDYLSEVQNAIFAPLTVKDPETGKQYPAIRGVWDPIDDPTVIGVEVRYRPSAQPDILLMHPQVPADQTLVTLANGIVSATLYQASTRLVTRPYRNVPWSAWQEVLTPVAPWNDVIFPDDLLEDVNELVERAEAFTGEVAREAREAARRLAMYGLEQDGANVLDKQDLRTVITATAQGMEARYANVVTLIVAQDQIIAQRFEEVAVQLGEKASVSAVSLLSSAITMQGETITAIGDAQIAIDAKVGNFYAGGILRFQQIATDAGALATGAFSVAASEGAATPSQAAIILSAKAGGISELGLISDRTYLRQGNELTQLATFSGGVFRIGGGIRANWAQIDNVQVTNAQIANAAITSTKRHGLIVQ